MKKAAMVLTLLNLIGIADFALGWQSPRQETQQPPRNLAILIFEGVQIIDYTGPYETFGRNASNTKPAKFLVVLLKEKGAPVLVPES